MPSTTVHPIAALTPELEAVLKEDTDRRLRNLIAANIKTRYARSSSQLSDFFLAINDKDLQNDESVLSDFHRLVPPTDYESYRPYMIMFNSRPCKLSEVEDMLAPGLPLYISLSSATSGKQCKQFAKYFMIPPSPNLSPFPVGVTSVVFTFAYRDPVEVVTDSGEVVARIPICNGSTGIARTQNNWTIETDDSRMVSIIPGHTAPWATGFIIHHRSFLLIHALFSLANTSLEGFYTIFVTVFMDMVHRIEEEWATLISSIRNGTIPDFEQIDHVRPYLQLNMHADPRRADELQHIGPPLSCPGWAQRVWPNLKLLTGICSGTFAAALPQARSILGPNVVVHNPCYICTECLIGRTLNFEDTETFVATTDELIEFLDVTQEPTRGQVLQAWDLRPGKFYQPVSTTRDGLWRYLIDDVIQVTWLRPAYSRRKNLQLRLPHAMITETDLVSAIHAISGEDVVEFPHTVGFFVSVAGEIGPNKAFAALVATNDEHQIAFDTNEFGLPTIRIIIGGGEEESMKVGVGQIKLPAVLSDAQAQKWMAERVMLEL
ncbi:GH3 auxin-responsive promoter-domain-containing protein [Pisolithus tinctorius]|nr:GH3 auxin-responsive promoter-domain-containing protein [Pisolithus tinctorius]